MFGSNSGSNSNLERLYIPEPSCTLDNKKMKAKTRKDKKEKKKAKAKKEKRIIMEVAKKKKKVKAKTVKEEKRVKAKVAKKKKKVEVKIAKKKKKIEAEVAKKKKLDNKAAKIVQIVLEKAKISKYKAVLLASNLLPKKKPRKLENNKTPRY